MNLRIAGTGSCLPKKVLTNADFAKFLDTSDEWIFSHTGIRERHVCDGDENACTIGVEAAKRALENAGIAASDLRLIICPSVVPSAVVPSLACQIMRDIGASCPAFDINAECTGFLYGLSIAEKMGNFPALVICAEQLTSFVDYTDRRTCILFGDGAGAAVVTGGDSFADLAIYATPDDKRTMDCPGVNHKDESGAFAPSFFRMDGQEVFKFATREMMRLITTSLERTNLTIEDIAYIVPHQANLRILQSCAERLRIGMDRICLNMEYTANISSATVPLALDILRRGGKVKPGDKLLLAAFGAGWTSGSAVMTL